MNCTKNGKPTPSITELLFDLGLTDEVVGITKFCIHPIQWRETKKIVGGTKNIDVEKIKELAPTLVIANKEENIKEQVEAIQKFTKVLLTDIDTIDQALSAIKEIGSAVQKEEKALFLVHQISEKFKHYSVLECAKKALYFIWKDPMMVAGKNTFIDDMLCAAGFENRMCKVRYPTITADEIKDLQPNYILLSSEPYPFKEKHIAEFQRILPSAKIILVDGEVFSWYGSRMLWAVDYFEILKQSI